MTNLERVRITFQGCENGTTFTWQEIVDMVKSKFPNDLFSSNSIIPSDYCYNLLNLGKINDPKLYDFNIFEYNDQNFYLYLGENYPYNKDIFHRPKGGRHYKIGSWINGERVIAPEKSINEIEYKDKVNSESNVILHKTSREPSLKLRYQVLQRDKFKCCACGSSPAKDPSVELHIDHIIPWSKGGETEINNLQTLCSRCNLGKSDFY